MMLHGDDRPEQLDTIPAMLLSRRTKGIARLERYMADGGKLRTGDPDKFPDGR